MTPAPRSGIVAAIKVTPMIDVMLVLLVVFMLTVQLRSSFDVVIPPPSAGQTPGGPAIILDLPGAGGMPSTVSTWRRRPWSNGSGRSIAIGHASSSTSGRHRTESTAT